MNHHRREQPAHQVGDTFLERLGTGWVGLAIRERKRPRRQDAVDVVAHPGVRVVAMHRRGCARRQQPGVRVLAREDDVLGLRAILRQALRLDVGVCRRVHGGRLA